MIGTGGFTFNQKKKVLDIGTVEVNTTQQKTITWPWYAGGAAILAGIAILIVDRPRKT